MTNQEINIGIAKLIYPDDAIRIKGLKVFIHVSGKTIITSGASFTNWDDFEVNYCKNWNDLMPLVIEHEISLDAYWDISGLWEANTKDKTSATNRNPQIALAKCLLKVLKEKK